ncbi:MAG: peptide-methionine (S)-S-oxide reductase MsrA [Opitutae bacterium]|nr:peptide-methionine (S)-S-oxide reductase MsrA [Opitutae bacterium]
MSPTASSAQPTKHEFAVFATGCFWCTEAVFQHVPGVLHSVSGYAGGTVDHPTYAQVSAGTTGHAECIRLEFDPAVVSYEKLVEIFFASHDPTTLNRQGSDEGTQYRSAIFYTDAAQQRAAARGKIAAQAKHEDQIVTVIEPLKKFWPAEDYHQDYFAKHPDQAYCRFVIKPKLSKLRDHGVITK